MPRLIDLTGRTFGPPDRPDQLTVLRRAGRNTTAGGKPMWWCRCRCGRKVRVQGQSLREGRQVSCGCLAPERGRKHLTAYWRGGGTSAAAAIPRDTPRVCGVCGTEFRGRYNSRCCSDDCRAEARRRSVRESARRRRAKA